MKLGFWNKYKYFRVKSYILYTDEKGRKNAKIHFKTKPKNHLKKTFLFTIPGFGVGGNNTNLFMAIISFFTFWIIFPHKCVWGRVRILVEHFSEPPHSPKKPENNGKFFRAVFIAADNNNHKHVDIRNIICLENLLVGSWDWLTKWIVIY